jgi:sugar lactone lactonase YvrE
MKNLWMQSFMALSIGAMLSSCGGNSTTQEEKTDTTSEEKTAESESKTLTLTKKWESDTSLTTCESLIYDEKNEVIYASNIGGVPPDKKDGDGFISKISTSGKVEELKWITGLNAPKGLGIFDGLLYVTDIDEVVEIDIQNKKIKNRYPVEKAEFLNDLDVDAEGNVFFTDSNTSRIWQLSKGKVTLWLEDAKIKGPNGILVDGEVIWAVSFPEGDFYKINKADKKMEVFAKGMKEGDGIVKMDGGFLVSAWSGMIYFVSEKGEVTTLLDTKADKINAADIAYIPSKNMLLVPTFFANKAMGYEVK